MTRDIPADPEDAAVPSPARANASSLKLIARSLDALAALTQNNPDYLLNLPQYPRIALEAPAASGGKFWLAAAMETGLSMRWGKLGSNGRVIHLPIGRCRKQNTVLELKARVLAKLRQGYDLIPHETILP